MTGTFDDARLERRAARLSVLLAAADDRPAAAVFPAERIATAMRRGVAMRRLRIAAAVALLMAGLGVPPVRAWIAGSVRTIWSHVMGAKQPVPAPSPAARPLSTAAMGAVSVPASDEFTLRVATRQAGGDLTIQVTDGRTVHVAVNGPAEAAELTVFPGAIRIGNATGTTAGYEVRVPIAVSRLVIMIGRESPRIFHPKASGERWVVSLRAP